MRSELRSTQRGAMMAGNSRNRHYGLLLLLALGAALLSVALLHKLRERRVAGLFHEQEQQLLALQLLLQKEREESKDVRNRLEEVKAKTISLINQKTELNNKLAEAEADVSNLRRLQREMEEALREKQNQINRVEEEKAAESISMTLRATALAEQLRQKEAEIEEMKQRLQPPKESAPAGDSSSPGSDASLSSTKEEENPQGGAEEKATHDPGDEKSSTEAGSATERANEQEQPSKEGTWVQLRTEVDDEDSKSETKGESNGEESKASEGNLVEKVEISEEGESWDRKEETGPESSTVQAPQEHEESPGREQATDETNGDALARKEQEVARDGEPERSDGSQSENEPKEGNEDSEKSDQNKPRHKRGKKRKNRTRSRRHDAELKGGGGGGAAAAGDEKTTTPRNAGDATTADALSTSDGGNGNSPPTDGKQNDEGVVETSKEGREGTQVEDGTEGRTRDDDEQQEQVKNAETFQETQTGGGSVLRETTPSEVDDGAIKESTTVSTTTSSERR